MRPRIAIALPLSSDPDYVQRSLPQYEHAVQMAGGAAVRIPLDINQPELKKLVASCDAVLLPGSKTDVDPAKYGAAKHEKTAEADPNRDFVDCFLLEDAYYYRKPLLGICYGLQSLNVYRAGSLIQHIPDMLSLNEGAVNHAAGRSVAVAHDAEIDRASTLAHIVADNRTDRKQLRIAVNSSHHQAVQNPGQSLRVVARCPNDGIIEAMEGTDPHHFVLAVQWHPERSVEDDEASRAIFRAFVEASRR